MEEHSESQKPNPNPKTSTAKNNNENYNNNKKQKTKTTKKKSEYEFCKVCNLNHDQGERHKYFPSHKSSLSGFLSRYHAKLSDVRFFLRNPSPLRAELASRNRLWCVFCDFDIDELGSDFACYNAINHLASADHLKNLKHFLWKYGGMDRLDNFRISEPDIAKWEKKCESLKSNAVSSNEGPIGPAVGPLNDIHNELNYGNISSFENSSIQSVKSTISNGVMPLHYHTNEYQVSHSGLSEVANIPTFAHDVSSSLPAKRCSGANLCDLKDLKVSRDSQHPFLSNSANGSADGYFNNERMYQVHEDEGIVKGESVSQGLQNLTRISTSSPEEARGNVHSGAPPPWLEVTEGSQIHVQLTPAAGSLVFANKSGKSKKLNPKRVGAAWAEKRKIELEMEKRGELVKGDYAANWLPNFGGVWQSGSRKESRKEFEMEKQNFLKLGSESEMPVKIQPYVSKRMRREAAE